MKYVIMKKEIISSGGRGAFYATIIALPLTLIFSLGNEKNADILFHCNISGFVSGLFGSKYGYIIGIIITMLLSFLWEIFEFQFTSFYADWMSDILVNLLGSVLYPIGEYVINIISE